MIKMFYIFLLIRFFYSVKKLTSNIENSITKYSLTDIANCYGISGYCYSILSLDCDVRNVENFNIAVISEKLFIVGCKTSYTNSIIEIMKINGDENNNVNLNMKTFYILDYNNRIAFNQINLNVLSNRIFFIFLYSDTFYYEFMSPNSQVKYINEDNTQHQTDSTELIGSSTNPTSGECLVNEYLEINIEVQENTKFDMESTALNNICSSHEFKYYIYFEKINIKKNYAYSITSNSENNVLYYSTNSDTDNKFLVELNKNYEANNKFYIKTTDPGEINIYYSINTKYKCTPNYQSFDDNNNDSDNILSPQKIITVSINGCNENCDECNYNDIYYECTKCKNGYYAISNETNFCYDKLSGYILKNDKWENCYEGCETCSKSINEIQIVYDEDQNEMFCNSCIEGYYKMVSNSSQCYSEYKSYYYNINIDKKEDNINEDNININFISSEKDKEIIYETNKYLNIVINSIKNQAVVNQTTEIINPNYGKDNSNI